MLSTANVRSLDGEIIGSYRGSSYYLYTEDIQGSTGHIVDSSVNIRNTYDYSDFGEVTLSGEAAIENEICYTGAVYDASTGLYYLNARYYDPENGRFISQDSYRGELDEIQQWHLYVYCANNPINYTDPTGHFSYSHSSKNKLITVKVSFNDLEVAGIIVSMNTYANIIRASKTCYKQYLKGKIPVICRNVAVVPKSVKLLNFTYLALLVGIQVAQKNGYTGFKFSLSYKTSTVKRYQKGELYEVARITIKPKVGLYK